MNIVQGVEIFILFVMIITIIYTYQEIRKNEEKGRKINGQLDTINDELQNIENNIYSVYHEIAKRNAGNEQSTKKSRGKSQGDTDREGFSQFVIKQFERLAEKFRQKHAQYKGNNKDELANFRAGALLKYGKADMAHMYETAKDYCRKHVAYIETHGIEGKTVEDSLEDIAVYAMIMLYMRKRSQQDAGNDQ